MAMRGINNWMFRSTFDYGLDRQAYLAISDISFFVREISFVACLKNDVRGDLWEQGANLTKHLVLHRACLDIEKIDIREREREKLAACHRPSRKLPRLNVQIIARPTNKSFTRAIARRVPDDMQRGGKNPEEQYVRNALSQLEARPDFPISHAWSRDHANSISPFGGRHDSLFAEWQRAIRPSSSILDCYPASLSVSHLLSNVAMHPVVSHPADGLLSAARRKLASHTPNIIQRNMLIFSPARG